MSSVPSNAPSYRRTRLACYVTNVAMAAVSALSPLLFVTFRELYGISYTLLGLLVVVNFCTQLSIDLIFSFFSHRFPIHKTVRIMPYLTVIGLLIYAILPLFFSNAVYVCLVVGTVIFSCSAGLAEVLISPLVAALPSEDPERDMSRLHSTYAWGLVGVVIFGSLFLMLVGTRRWQLLAIAFALIPTAGAWLFSKAFLPDMGQAHAAASGQETTEKKPRTAGLLLCVVCIFLGGAAEGTMTQWISGYVETALTLPKTVGDILGMAMFATMLGLGRTLYAKRGRNILRVMLLGMIASTVCYLTASLILSPMIGLIACVITGLAVSMLWPGSIILVETKFPSAGVAAYALMAAGGDLGGALAPQLVGLIADAVSASSAAARLASITSMTAEQIGMRAGLLSATVFPLVGIALICIMIRRLRGG